MQTQAPQPILVLDPTEVARLQRAHRHLHVSFDLFSTELQRLEATKMFLPQWQFPEQENSEEWTMVSSPSPVVSPDGPHSALDVQIQSYRSYSAKCNGRRRLWESVRQRDQSESEPIFSDSDYDDKDDDTVCAEMDYQLHSEEEKQVEGEAEGGHVIQSETGLTAFKRLCRAYQALIHTQG
ncbi:hypothetical protein ZYGR_0AK03820 [Zygosaccharomyces rouxii]|uniref:Uncharacterized protein n=1 Tax=Zygosaccharomyces rouxii TaxID=4956 RepID=A0A1Q3AE02_ZYGRO|nr:hypothetical protein ZYGR_0AK03820 [Zygosaccharomyces rouxii]